MSDDNTPRELVGLVLSKITELGDKAAQEYFGVSAGTISAWKTLKTFPSIVAAQKVWDDTLLCQAPEMWGKVADKVHILLPVYESMEPLTFVTLFRCCKLYGMDKVQLVPELRTLIDEARNTLAQKAILAKGYAVFVDADMVLPCGNGPMLRTYGYSVPEPKASRNALERIMSHPPSARIVGAIYRNRRGTHKPACAKAYGSPEGDRWLRGLFDGTTQSDELIDAGGWVGFGMVRIHYTVFEEMQAAAVPGGPLEEIRPPVGREKDAFGYFGRTPQWRGEDISFCRRAEKIGIKTQIDTGLLLGHVAKVVV